MSIIRCCCGGPCWFLAKECDCEPEPLPPGQLLPAVPCDFVTGQPLGTPGFTFRHDGICWLVADNFIIVEVIPEGYEEVIPSKPLYGSCQECCTCFSCSDLLVNDCETQYTVTLTTIILDPNYPDPADLTCMIPGNPDMDLPQDPLDHLRYTNTEQHTAGNCLVTVNIVLECVNGIWKVTLNMIPQAYDPDLDQCEACIAGVNIQWTHPFSGCVCPPQVYELLTSTNLAPAPPAPEPTCQVFE